MTPGDLQQLLLTCLPELPGVAAADPWPERPYGLVLTMAGTGGCSFWMVTGALALAPAPAKDAPPLQALPLPDLPPGKIPLGLVEQTLLAAVVQADRGVTRVDRFSTRDVPPTLHFGATIDCDDTWRLFLSAIGTSTGPSDRLRPVTPASEV